MPEIDAVSGPETAADAVPWRLCAIVLLPHSTFSEEVLCAIQAEVSAVYMVTSRTLLELLKPIDCVVVIGIDDPRHRGIALAAAFERAWKDGFTHAVTMALDGRHRPEEIALLAERSREVPRALVIGARRFTARTPTTARFRFLRACGNGLIFYLTTRWIPDSQSSFRIYPLEDVEQMVLRAKGSDFETEALTKALWSSIPVESVPVNRDFSPAADAFWRSMGALLGAYIVIPALVIQRMIFPPAIRRLMHLKEFRRRPFKQRLRAYVDGILFQEDPTPGVFAWSVAIGIFLGIMPIWGLQIIVAMAIANRSRISGPVAVTGTGISFGPMLPVVLYASLLTGELVLTGQVDFSLGLERFSTEDPWQYIVEYLVGSVVLAFVVGAISGVLGWLFAKYWLADSPMRIVARAKV